VIFFKLLPVRVLRTLAVLPLLFPALGTAEFRFRINEDLGSLDWTHGEVPAVIVQQLMEGLTVSGPKGEAVPALATKWDIRDRGLTYLFHLRRGARWSDGKPICAQHFVDAWKQAMDPKTASSYAHLFFDIRKVSAQGCALLRVDLKRPAPYFPALVSHWVFYPVRTDAPQAVTGPYLLEEWARDDHFTFKRNPYYYGAPGREEKLKAVVVPDDATALTLFRKGSLDWVKDIPLLERAQFAKVPEYRFFPTFVEYHLGFRFGDGGKLSKEARCALSMAIDKSKIPSVLGGKEIPADSLLPSGLRANARAKTLASFDPLRARAMWPKELRQVELYYYAKDAHVPLMQWVQEQWRTHLGVNVELRQMEGKSYWSLLSRDAPQIFLSGITAEYAHPFSLLSEFLSDSRANWGHFASKAYDEAAYRADVDEAERILLAKECAVVPLYFRSAETLVSKRWQGFLINPLSAVYLKNVSQREK
jgi:oligopeptide transport system substrate-binding protein